MIKILRNIKLVIPMVIIAALASNVLGNTRFDKITEVFLPSSKEDMPVLGSFRKLKSIIGYNYRSPFDRLRGIGFGMEKASNAAENAAPSPNSDSGRNSSGDYSTTNTQVKGVDEADIIKTDGEYVYAVNNNKLTIVKAEPADNMQIQSQINFSDKNFHPQEMYLDDKHLVVIGYTHITVPLEKKGASDSAKPGQPGDSYMPSYRYMSSLKTIVYDISDKSNLKSLREVELEGYYISSRKVDSILYLVANKHLGYHYGGDVDRNEGHIKPIYRDSARGDDYKTIGFDDIRYFPDSIEPNFLLLTSIDLDDMSKEVNVQTYLGSGQNIYMSRENLYIAVNKYEETNANRRGRSEITTAPGTAIWGPVNYSSNTLVYKFALNGGKLDYVGKGEVPGHIINQFSMDEHNGYFRIATTKGDIWRSDEFTSKNNVYVLDEKLTMAGKIEDIAPGERIYSVRFMGNRGYMVTFKTVDPLFVIDLENPRAPKILGELKIPGYSEYLHPYDENHIIGFGKDAVEIIQKDYTGKVIGANAFYLGMKIALFDVSDVNNPKEKFVEMIGDRGTDSELLRNHKALLFSKEKNLLAFPIMVAEVKKDDSQPRDANFPAYGTPVFQGAYVYNIDLEKGFELRGKVTHTDKSAYPQNIDYYWYDWESQIQRIIYIKDTLYTMSPSLLKATDMKSLQEKGFINIQ